ncbi:hypothetical protein KUTeg_013321 [Tegillarca granosa]|uniref:PX domain-containing protein n=1 Tax=Tegillarca granosa TaxID=220873 RepID=A0ABQ9EWT6_TEGGR|nr:hypothetical protein KUTeg_013321 [Tegillarca granosa]
MKSEVFIHQIELVDRHQYIKKIMKGNNKAITFIDFSPDADKENCDYPGRKGVIISVSNLFEISLQKKFNNFIPTGSSSGSGSVIYSDSQSVIRLSIPAYRSQGHGSDSHFEYEIKMAIGDDQWTVFRRYSRFRKMHQDLKRKIPEVGALVFPPRKLFSRTERVVSERRKQLEVLGFVFFEWSILEVLSDITFTITMHLKITLFIIIKEPDKDLFIYVFTMDTMINQNYYIISGCFPYFKNMVDICLKGSTDLKLNICIHVIMVKAHKLKHLYLRHLIEIFIQTPTCPLHPSQNKYLTKQLLCDFEPFFKLGLFETSKHGTT